METGAREAFTTDLAEAMINATDSAIVAIDSAGRVVRWNRAAVALTGISAGEIRGRMFSRTVVWPEDRERWKQEFESILAGLSSGLFEIRWKKHENCFQSVTCSCSTVHDRDGGIRYVVCTATHSISQAVMGERTAEFHDISRYIHDTITQDLVVVSFQLSMLEEAATEFSSTPTTDPEAAAVSIQQQAQHSVRLIERCCRHVRVISALMASPSLEGITLEAAIEQLATFVDEEAGLGISLDLDPIGEAIPAETQLLILMAVKSWLGRSVWTRAQPRISFRLRSPHNGGVVLGMEIAPPVVKLMQGWSVVRERAEASGGEFSIASEADRLIATMSFPGRAQG